MYGVGTSTINKLKALYGDDFLLAIESSANEHGVHKGIEDYITIYSSKVRSRQESTIDSRRLIINPMPEMELATSSPHVLSLESIFLLYHYREEFITGEAWDTLTDVVELWDKEYTQVMLNKLPKELYDMNAQAFLDHFDSDGYGA